MEAHGQGVPQIFFFSTNYNHATWWPGKKRNSTFTLETEAETFLSIETKKNWKKNQRPILTETKTLPQSLLSQVSTKPMLKPKLWKEKSTQKKLISNANFVFILKIETNLQPEHFQIARLKINI